ncbi:MAG: biotin/lipoyl-containing protein [Ferruginibacter sp.]
MPENKTFKVKAGEFEFEFSQDDIDAVDFIKHNNAEFNLIRNYRSATARLVDEADSEKQMKLEVDGDEFDVEIKDSLDQMLDSMGFNAAAGKHIREIKAPMPGLVINVAVKEGQQLMEGERVLILEAMKMENSIMLHANATIKKIHVKAGQAVDKGQVLVELE